MALSVADKKHHPMWRPHTPYALTVTLGVLAFVVVSLVSYRAVAVANHGQEDARNEAQLARIAASDSQEKLNQLQRQLDCVVNVLATATAGNLRNSVAQDDMLLGGFEGGDRATFVAILKEVSEELKATADEVAQIEKKCS